ncbi:hypothetical protein LCGC14_1699940 [marine sediment metagenome]|uniref:Double zinc ribbon domain-containing protein n=1 Tax=marine sediment metagenome TaxID=412755 RepID=A0A0F9JYW0_9ZZZZ
MATLDREDFTRNVGLQAMRNSWRAGHEHFDQDRFGIYPVSLAFAEAEARPGGSVGSLRKTCELCGGASRNDPCDDCYAKFREVLEPGWGFGLATKFCVVCFNDADESGKLCALCRRLLSGHAGV